MFVSLVEPTVQNAQIEHAVQGCLHAAGAAGLLAAPRVVEPQIHALDHLARHLHVVVFDEDQVFPQVGVAGKLHQFPDVGLAGGVLRMSLAGNDHLHRHVLIQQDALQPFHVPE